MTERFRNFVKTHQMVVGIAVAAFCFVGYLLSLFLRRPDDAWLHVSFVNEYCNVGSGFSLYDDFVRENADGRRVVFDANYFFDLSNDRDFANAYFQKLVAYLENGATDAVICTEENLCGIARGGRLLDLRDERAIDIYERYADRLYMYEDEEEGMVPVGIDLSGSPYEAELGYQEIVYLGISFKGTNIEQVELLLKMLLP